MITRDNFREILILLGFSEKNKVYTKHFREFDAYLKANFSKNILIYPEDKGLNIGTKTPVILVRLKILLYLNA